MRFFLASAVFSILLTGDYALAQQDISAGDTGPFRIETFSYVGSDGRENSYERLVHDELEVWSAVVDTDYFLAAINASSMSNELSWAVMQLRCEDTFAGLRIKFGIEYTFEDGEYPGDSYRLDLFNSVGSGRPAAFNVGSGFVRTDHIDFFAINAGQPPQAYLEGTMELWRDLQSMGTEERVEVRFETDRVNKPYLQMVFPLSRFQEIARQAEPYCP